MWLDYKQLRQHRVGIIAKALAVFSFLLGVSGQERVLCQTPSLKTRGKVQRRVSTCCFLFLPSDKENKNSRTAVEDSLSIIQRDLALLGTKGIEGS